MRISTLSIAPLLFALPVFAQPAPDAPPPVVPPPPATVAPPPPASPGQERVAFGLTTLNLLKSKGVITEAEYESALRDLGESAGSQAGDAPTLVLGRWSTTLYGFVEADHLYDTTQSFTDLPGNTQVARPTTYAGDHGRFTMGVRNSRIGFKLRAPEYHRVRASAMLEMDFLGNQPTTATEAQFFTSPGFRVRHFNVKVETPIVDVLVGQYWQLFGWQSTYHPSSVAIQGVPGQLYSRTPQLRLSKTIKSAPLTIEVAAAMMRPPQRDSATPEGQAGVRLSVNGWKGRNATGSSGAPTAQPLSVAVTGDLRHFELAEFSAAPKASVGQTGWGVAADAFVPLLPDRWLARTGSLSLNGEYAYGYGIADLYTGLNGGASNAPLPNPMMLAPAPLYTANVDPGLALFTADGLAHLVQWQSYLIGLQYHLPRLDGRVWVSGNYSHMSSNNAASLGAAAKVLRSSEDWFDVNLFADVTPAVRLGFEYSQFRDHYVDGLTAINDRFHLAAFYLF